MPITPKTPDEQNKMRTAGRLAAQVLDMIGPHIQPGVTTDALNQICHDYIVGELGVVPAPLNYRGFPKSICTSLNHVVCHGIPGDRVLKNGDIMNVDITVIADGYHGDTSRMFSVGPPSVLARRLMKVSFDAMWAGIEQIRPGVDLSEVGRAIQTLVEKERFSVVREYCGHGIGRIFHDDPQVLHYLPRKPHPVPLVPGMTFTVEPMVNAGKRGVKLLNDGWTVVTKDHSLSAQWEHTVLVTDDGFEVLTLPSAESEAQSPLAAHS